LRFPLPVSPDLGLNGRAFVDVGSLSEASFRSPTACEVSANVSCQITQSSAPRVGAGVGISWRTAFGLINVDLAPFVLKQPGDQTQIFRFGFGTRF
ncbi:MAG: outer membrane protein insertion porin family, partial [Acetobacteraceae bacterium]|nr:outer membrane protein insertion porin family [Acetobacteraceae bacterium]